MNYLDFLMQQYNNYKASDIPAASLLRGDYAEFPQSFSNSLANNLSLLSTPEGAMDIVNPISRLGGLLGTTKQIIGKSGVGGAKKEINTLKKGYIKDHNFRKRIEEETGLEWSDLRTDNNFMKKYKQLNNNKNLSREDKVQEGVSWINKNLSEYPE